MTIEVKSHRKNHVHRQQMRTNVNRGKYANAAREFVTLERSRTSHMRKCVLGKSSYMYIHIDMLCSINHMCAIIYGLQADKTRTITNLRNDRDVD